MPNVHVELHDVGYKCEATMLQELAGSQAEQGEEAQRTSAKRAAARTAVGG